MKNLAPVQINVPKTSFNDFGVHITAKDRLKNVRNVVFSLLCILVGRPMGGGRATVASLPWLRN